MHHKTIIQLFYFFFVVGLQWGLRKICLSTLDIYEYITIGIFSYAFFMLLIIFITKGFSGFKINTKKLTPEIIIYLICLGLLSALFKTTLVSMNKNEDLTILPALVSAVTITSVGLFGIFFLKEKITAKKLISTILIFIGIFFYFKE
jgi:drug/metabolite transporter (DMT)-like permease